MASKQGRVFSGVQPTGIPHLGNYLGAIRNWVEMQADYETIFCMVDMHAITVPHDPAKLREDTRRMTACYLAAGIDPKVSIVFNQSQVAEHAELAWIFNCVARIGWLNRMTQFKDKAGKDRENSSAGLLVYPCLMAADILAYKATHVPVGEDQKQHLELTRDIAQKFNHDFGVEFFPLPDPVIREAGARIMSLRDGTAKMSKSDPSDYSRINLTDDADAIAQKIKKARTDPDPLPGKASDLESRAEAQNLVEIYATLANKSMDAVCQEFEGKMFSAFKPALADLLISQLGPITTEMNRLLADPTEVDRVLHDGAARAHAIADPIVQEVYDIVGFLRP
jgi:tryptophanyl-tRNA synthetase